MFINMPPTFPQKEFQGFGKLAVEFLPELLSEQWYSDPLQKRQHFDRAWMAVCYRYRTCAECNDEFQALLSNAPDSWRVWNADQEYTYKMERCLYAFFINGLSVFESFAFCLYFLGGVIRPGDFPHMANPKQITLETTKRLFVAAFPTTAITGTLENLLQDPSFVAIDEIRNILAHRLSGMRSVRTNSTYPDGPHMHEEVWHVIGGTEFVFDKGLIQCHLDAITNLLTGLTAASLKFTEDNKLTKTGP